MLGETLSASRVEALKRINIVCMKSLERRLPIHCVQRREMKCAEHSFIQHFLLFCRCRCDNGRMDGRSDGETARRLVCKLYAYVDVKRIVISQGFLTIHRNLIQTR